MTLSKIGCPGLRGIGQRWQNNCSVDLQFGFGAETLTFPYFVIALAMQRVNSSSNNADFESVLPR